MKDRSEYFKAYRIKNIERQREYYKKYLLLNHQKVKDGARTRKQKRRLDILLFLGNKCIRCGFSDLRALNIDHINGGGNQERRNCKDSDISLYRCVKSHPEKYQLLCANCNWIKRYEMQEHGAQEREGLK